MVSGMAPLPVIADVFRTTLNWEGGGGEHAHNVLHFRGTGGDSDDLSVAIFANATLEMWSSVATAAAITSLSILPLDGTSPTTVYPVAPADAAKFTGNGGSEWNGGQVAGLVRLQTGVRGPANRGRIYLPFNSEANCTSGIIAPVVVDAATSAWATFMNDMIGDGFALGVASYKHSNWHQALNVFLDDNVATQKRRNKRV